MPPGLNRKTYLGLTVAGLMLSSSPSLAGGSVEIAQVIRLAGQSPELMNEIHNELTNAGRALADVQWNATRLGRHRVHLGGLRIPPYTCDVGNRVLEVNGVVEFYDEEGAPPDEETRHESARYVSESQPEWSWK